MTLIETLVAITILTVAIVSPMSLTMQSLSAAYYARDQITAFNLAQEAVESVRSARDENILRIAYGQFDAEHPPGMDILHGFYIGELFTIDARDNAMTRCTLTDTSDPDLLPDCPRLQTDSGQNIYGYGLGANTKYTRSVLAEFVEGSSNDEIRVTVTVRWQAGPTRFQDVVIKANFYRWVNDSSV